MKKFVVGYHCWYDDDDDVCLAKIEAEDKEAALKEFIRLYRNHNHCDDDTLDELEEYFTAAEMTVNIIEV